jgi:5-hydroxyisourate hydrolase-like protein (transthyretin family)
MCGLLQRKVCSDLNGTCDDATASGRTASVSGTVVQTGTGTPLANIRVSLAQTDVALGAFAQMMASGNRPAGNMVVPGEVLTAMYNGRATRNDAEAKAIAALPREDIAELHVYANSEVSVVNKSVPPVMTNAQGQFTFSNVRPGTYRLVFAADGYARQEYGQRSPGGTGVPLVINIGQSRSDIVMRMSQVSAVEGRVADTEGQPVAGVPVQLLRFEYDETGKRNVQSMASNTTDDRGQFRMFDLSPGRYYLSAGNLVFPDNGFTSITTRLDGGRLPQLNRIPEKYSLSYYPGTPDINAATPIDVPSGADIKDINVYVKVPQFLSGQGFRRRSGIRSAATQCELLPEFAEWRSSRSFDSAVMKTASPSTTVPMAHSNCSMSCPVPTLLPPRCQEPTP